MNINPELLAVNERLLAKRKERQELNRRTTQADQGDVDAMCQRLLKHANEAAEFKQKVELFIKTQAKLSTCPTHGCKVAPDLDRSVQSSRAKGIMVLEFAMCPKCQEVVHGPDNWLIKAGVPRILAESRFESWKIHNPVDQIAVTRTRSFCKRRAGFLVLLGTRGLGKSHLAVSAMAELHCGLFVTQLMLLKQMRRHDYDGQGVDIVEKAKRTRLLVLDELGLSSGGKDEMPMLYEVLDYRHSNYLPTIFTGNLSQAEFAELIGERIADRLKQSLFDLVVLKGTSMRGQLRATYGV